MMVVMNSVQNDDYKNYNTPGQLLDALLTKRGWNQRTLGIVLGIDETGVNRLVTAKRPFTAELALTFEDLFGEPAEHFLDLQKKYDLSVARISTKPDPARSTRAQLFGDLPITDMIKRGWIIADDIKDVPAVEKALMKFFDAPSLEEIEILPHAAKKTLVAEDVTPAQLAWLYRVKTIASEMMVNPYSPAAVKSAVTKLSALRSAPELARSVPRILAECGIRYVIVESLPSAKIDGVCFWLDKQSPVIGMSLRLDRIDNFWFVLRHEVEHVLRLHGQSTAMVDAELEGEKAGTGESVTEEERIANQAAADFCVPDKLMKSFIERKSPFFAGQDIIGFARTLGVHPGLIAGQLQHRTGRYELFRAHLAKVRTMITPSAMVDGWGDVAPIGS